MNPQDTYVRRHLRFGWWALLLFLSLGFTLEVMHGFKIGYYLSVSNETRRLMWRLAHSHGALFGLVNIGFALTVRLSAADGDPVWRRIASRCFLLGGALLPLGFFLGGIIVDEGDPWVGILLVPVAAAFLFVATLLTALNASRDVSSDSSASL